MAGGFYKQKQKLVSYLSLKTVNDSLLKENARLRNEVGVTIAGNPLKDTNYIKNIQSDTVTQTIHYNYIPAKVLNNSIDQKVNYITLNVGARHGIRKKMVVISANGIVGKISHVSENYSIVLSMLSERFIISAMVADGTVGKLGWDGKEPEYATLSGIPQSVKLKAKDTVYTSGYGNFPEKIMIGRVAQVMGGTSYKIYLSTNFRKLHFVYVIAEEINIERKQLEDSTLVTP